MARGPAPVDGERNPRSKPPAHGWEHAGGVGWRHGDTPKAPAGLLAASREAWRVWFGAWFAWFWTEDDIPALRQLVRLYDQIERGEFQRHPELRLMMDTYGITPKGRQDRRWRPPTADATPTTATSTPADTTYEGLYAVANDS